MMKSIVAGARGALAAIPVIVRDLVGLAGAGLVAYGAWLIYQPAGRLTYMAPEVGRGDLRRAGPPADIFAFGVIMSEVLTGRPPFAVRRTHLDQVRNPPRVAPSRWRVDLPHGLDLICLKCLNQDPHDRYENAEALADDLRRFRDGRPLQAQPWLTRLVGHACGLFRR